MFEKLTYFPQDFVGAKFLFWAWTDQPSVVVLGFTNNPLKLSSIYCSSHFFGFLPSISNIERFRNARKLKTPNRTVLILKSIS
jgi:hypothetical protein